jgi:ABC-type amino acid transport system permease subunit
MEQDSAGAPARASLVNDPKVRGLFYQALLIARFDLLWVLHRDEHDSQPGAAEHCLRLGLS